MWMEVCMKPYEMMSILFIDCNGNGLCQVLCVFAFFVHEKRFSKV